MSFLSQFPGEDEVLMPPRSNIEVLCVCVCMICGVGVCVCGVCACAWYVV